LRVEKTGEQVVGREGMIKMCRNMEIVIMVPVKLGRNLYISQRVIVGPKRNRALAVPCGTYSNAVFKKGF